MVVTLGVVWYYAMYWVKARNAAKHLMMHLDTPNSLPQDIPGLNSLRTLAEKPCSILSGLQPVSALDIIHMSIPKFVSPPRPLS